MKPPALFSRVGSLFIRIMRFGRHHRPLMKDEITNRLERKPSWKRPFVWVPVVSLAFLVGSVAIYTIRSGSEVEAELVAIKKRSLPSSPVELDTWYKRVPAENNAALIYQRAYSLHVEPGRDNPQEIGKELKVGDPLPEELRTAAENYLKDNAETLDQIHAAALLKEGRFPIDLTKGFSALLPHLAPMKRMGILMKWQVIYQSAQGKREDAVQGLEDAFAMAAILEEEPLFLSALVRIAMTAMIVPAMERVLTEHSLTEAELQRLESIVERALQSGRKSMLRGMVGERAVGLSAFDMKARTVFNLGGGGGSPSAADLGMEALFDARRALGMHNQDRMFYLQRMRESEAALTNDYPEMLRAGEEVTMRLEEGIKAHRFRYIISGMLLPALSKGAQKEALLAAQLRCVRAALAIDRFRLKHGRLPAPKELVPEYLVEWPKDTVNGEPIQYEQLPIGFELISLGATELKNKGKKTNLTDVAFRVLR